MRSTHALIGLVYREIIVLALSERNESRSTVEGPKPEGSQRLFVERPSGSEVANGKAHMIDDCGHDHALTVCDGTEAAGEGGRICAIRDHRESG